MQESAVVPLQDPMLKYPQQRYKEMLGRRIILWILVRLHAAEKQNVCGWTGFNILVRDEIEVRKDNIGYCQLSMHLQRTCQQYSRF